MNALRAALPIAAALALACANDPGRNSGSGPKLADGDPPLPGIAEPAREITDQLATARSAKGTAHVPRTRHLNADGSPKYTNRLIAESSPYLLQHAHNPVNWYPWGDDAFLRAKRENKPVLLSVGYSTCHWCHVMEHESFEDEEIAEFLNQNFVSVKVDREERPDVDDVYMQAVQMMTGAGGWPMTLVLTPEREPFFGATYIPPRDGVRGARRGFLSILRELAALYERDPQHVLGQAGELSARMREAARAQPAAGVPSGQAIYLAASHLARGFDPAWGGFGGAPKFPQPSAHELLLRYYRRTNDAQALQIVVTTLEKMAAGGIYDHVGGGFHRYATDRYWLVPHFEKMLYDNAQLAALYLDAYQIVHNKELARVASDVLGYVAREMSSPEGGFYSATDADSKAPDGHDVEGYFFTWTAAEIDAVVGADDARLVRQYYGVTDPGDFEGRNILHVSRPIEEVAGALGLDTADATQRLSDARKKLYEARSKRPAPGRDEKILTSWNALMISAFARAGFVLDSPDYRDRARRAADFILHRMRDADGRLLRSFKDGVARHAGYLDDHAFMIQALLDLYESTWEARWLEGALALQEILDREYLDVAGGGYYMTRNDAEGLLMRRKPQFDGAEPSGNSVAALNLFRLAEFTSREELRARGEKTLQAFASTLSRGSPATPKMLAALDFYLDEPLEVVLVGAADDGQTRSDLLAAARALYFPNRMFSVHDSPTELAKQVHLIPLLEGKQPLGGRSTAYVCKKGVCDLPTSDVMKFGRQLVTVEPLLGESDPPALPIVRAQDSQVP